MFLIARYGLARNRIPKTQSRPARIAERSARSGR
jgi:hypothetical protein